MKEKISALLPFLSDDGFWQQDFLGNTIADYLIAVIIFVFFIALFKVFQGIILYKLNRLAEKTKTDIDDAVIMAVRSVRPPFYLFVAFFFALKFLVIEDLADKIVTIILIAWGIVQVIIAVQILINYMVERGIGKYKDEHAKSAMRLMGTILKVVLWSVGILLFLSNLGVNVTSLVAGFGIGGIAVALALQNVLGDLFSSFAIYFDRPFAVGDFIMIGNDTGTVVKVGIKTTRVKMLRGEELVVSNTELASIRVQNLDRMKKRRILFSLGVTYQTPTTKVRRIPGIIKKIINEQKIARFDRAHFKQFGDSALIFEVVYFVKSPEYVDYVNVNQKILLKIKQVFENEKIDFAYPTQTVFLEK